jgi:hypothetical protein
MELADFFTAWGEKAPSSPDTATASSSAQGVLCSMSTKGTTTTFRVQVPAQQELVSASISAAADLKGQAMPELMDEVAIDGGVVRCVTPWRQLVADKANEHVPLPLPQSGGGQGRPFLVYSGMPNAPVWINTEPGLHRIVEWNPPYSVTFFQRQWLSFYEMSLTMPQWTMQLTLCEKHCEPLMGKNVEEWEYVMQANPVPFYALVRVDDNECGQQQRISLSALAVQWDLQPYLERFCLEVSPKTVKSLVPSVAVVVEANKDRVYNISATNKMPTGPGWRYYALTANRAKLEGPSILFAAWTAVASKTKKAKQED